MSTLAESIQVLGIYVFVALVCVAVALMIYLGLCSLLAEMRRGERTEKLGTGPFNLRRESTLRQRYARRHEVQVRGRWHSHSRWVPRD